MQWCSEAEKLVGEKKYSEALFCSDKALESAQTNQQHYWPLISKIICLCELDRDEEALPVCDEFVRRFGDEQDSEFNQ